MHYRRITSADLPAVLALQEASLFSNLTEQQREEGFLSAAFTQDHFRQMADELAVLVADDAGKVCGYLCAGSVSFHTQFPLLAAMVTALDACSSTALRVLRSLTADAACCADSTTSSSAWLPANMKLAWA